MAFTKKQQEVARKVYRTLIEVHCARNGLRPASEAADRVMDVDYPWERDPTSVLGTMSKDMRKWAKENLQALMEAGVLKEFK